MKAQRRILSLALVLAILLALLAVPMASAAGTATYNGVSYSTDYKTWRQGNPAWGETPLGDLHTMTRSGCLVTSIAILMCHSGAYDPAALNPGTFRDWLDSKGFISHSSTSSNDALLSYGPISSSVSPRFYYVGREYFPVDTPLEEVCAKIDELRGKGLYLVARVNNSGHFVAVDGTIENSTDATIFDPGYASKTRLSAYNGTIGGLLYFRANTTGTDTILPQITAPSAPKPGPIASTYGDGDRLTLTWTIGNRATHHNLYVDRKKPDGTWEENYKAYFYVVSPYAIEALPAGSYRLKLQAASSTTTPWTFTNADYLPFTVQADSLTITYDPAGGKVSPTTQLVKQSATYDLPTPTKSGSAFLGWYSDSGEFVTAGVNHLSNTGHTLTARWTTSGVGFSKTGKYNGNFKDVTSNAWYRGSVASVYEYGLMNGTEVNKFGPDGNVTAAQTITMAARLRKQYLTGNGSFAATDPWYKAYTDYALSQGILSSLPKDLNAPLTRQEFASILGNALPSDALPAVNKVADGAIPDVYRSDTAIYQLYRAGVFTGSDMSGTFRPNASISRAEAAAVLVRMVDPNSRMRIELN